MDDTPIQPDRDFPVEITQGTPIIRFVSEPSIITLIQGLIVFALSVIFFIYGFFYGFTLNANNADIFKASLLMYFVGGCTGAIVFLFDLRNWAAQFLFLQVSQPKQLHKIGCSFAAILLILIMVGFPPLTLYILGRLLSGTGIIH